MEKELLDYFKVMKSTKRTKVMNYSFMTKGIMLDFIPTDEQKNIISAYVRDANVQTLFSVEEVALLSADEKFIKQVHHYILQFGTGYTLDVVRSTDRSDIVTITLIRGVTQAELQYLVDDSLYSNRPVKNSKTLAEIIKFYNLDYRINDVKNNELRVLLFDVSKDVFTNGDDAVRYIVNTCTDSDLLIKSPQIIKAIQANPKVTEKFLWAHKMPLAQVYNRHKRLLMALKIGSTNGFVKRRINQIARLSKNNHVPYVMPYSKTFVADVFKNYKSYKYKNLDVFSLRDKMKLLNLLEFKAKGLPTDIFTIRNGKVHVAEDRPIYDKERLDVVIKKVLDSIKKDLKSLKDKIILLPEKIEYGLPVSRKQSLGHLPFGTKIHIDTNEISSGIYWRNEWGARDLDLSAIDLEGRRTGWGSLCGYDRGHTTGVQFSGDIVNAPDGAMEFLTSHSQGYGLFVNIFSGEIGAKTQIVVGERARKNWIDMPVIREEVTLKSRSNLVGIVDGKVFTVFYGKMNDNRISGVRNRIMIQKALTMTWTVPSLFAYLGIAYTHEAKKPDYDLSYAGFTYDKLEALFET